MTVANSATVRSGHGGKVFIGLPEDTDTTSFTSGYLLARVTQWSVAYSVTEHTWADSDSQGYTNRSTGRRDITGTITGKLDRAAPAYQNLLFTVDTDEPENNDMISLVLWEDGNLTSPVKKWYLPRCAVTSFNMSYDMDTKAPVEWTANFGADGIFYWPGASGNPTISTVGVTYKALDESE